MIQHCPNPFEWLDITAWNDTDVKFSLCVESWGGEDARLAILPISEAADLDLMELWNGEKARDVRSKVIHHPSRHPRFCDTCPKWMAGDEPVVQGTAAARNTTSPGPKVLNLAYDRSCNLSCPSCRTECILHRTGTKEHSAIKRFQDNCVRPLLKTAERAYVAGLGDPFASPCYRELLETVQPEDAPLLKWAITTNGLLFTPEQYAKIPTHRQIDTIHISIDAATEETYRTNRAGSWKRLMNALDFAGDLRASGAIERLVISMVVQQNNYHEAVRFALLGKHVDSVKFSALLNQDTYSDSDYTERAVHIPSHPEHANAIDEIHAARILGEGLGKTVTMEMPR